MQNIKTR